LAAIDAEHVEARQTIFDNLVLAVIPRAPQSGLRRAAERQSLFAGRRHRASAPCGARRVRAQRRMQHQGVATSSPLVALPSWPCGEIVCRDTETCVQLHACPLRSAGQESVAITRALREPACARKKLADDYAASSAASAEDVALVVLSMVCALMATSVRFFAASFLIILRTWTLTVLSHMFRW